MTRLERDCVYDEGSFFLYAVNCGVTVYGDGSYNISDIFYNVVLVIIILDRFTPINSTAKRFK